MRDAVAALKQSHERRAVTVANDVYALTQNRIIQKGEDSKGSRFPGYSKKQVPKFFFRGRSRNAGAETRVAKAKKTLSYEDFRKINNLQTGHVDLYFTGEMWRGTGVAVVGKQNGRIMVAIQGKTEPAKKKVDWNSARYGESILTPSSREIDMARRAYFAATIKTLKPFFG